jgi:23S rRNA (adenine2503-C2)-methyltransferase
MFGRGAGEPLFRHHLRGRDSAPIRRPRGRDIMAACGQLKSAAEKKSRAELDRLAEEKQAALA